MVKVTPSITLPVLGNFLVVQDSVCQVWRVKSWRPDRIDGYLVATLTGFYDIEYRNIPVIFSSASSGGPIFMSSGVTVSGLTWIIDQSRMLAVQIGKSSFDGTWTGQKTLIVG